MADSDSGTHVTDISEGLQDELDVRKEGIRIIITLGFFKCSNLRESVSIGTKI